MPIPGQEAESVLFFSFSFVARELFMYGAAACLGELKWSDLLAF
jgi:hypothetical protein